MDTQVALSERLEWTFHQQDKSGRVAASRIDLALANHAMMAFIKSIKVVSQFQHGGHFPVMLELHLRGPVSIEWRPPRPQLPVLLTLSSMELLASPPWKVLLSTWSASPTVQAALSPTATHSLDSLSAALLSSLRLLVQLAGGWSRRPAHRRLAYDSNAMRRLRQQMAALHDLANALRRDADRQPGPWPRLWHELLRRLDRLHISLPAGSLPEMRQAVATKLHVVREELGRLERECRAERSKRWRQALPRLWRERPGVVYSWLRGDSPLGAPHPSSMRQVSSV